MRIFLVIVSLIEIFHESCWAQLIIQPFSDYTTKRSSPIEFRSNTTQSAQQILQNLIDIFKFSRSDIKWFEVHFSIRSIELIYPKSWSHARQLKRCVLGMRFKHAPSKSAAIKLEFDSQVRSRYDANSRSVVCNHPSRPSSGMPTERYIANLVRSNPYFIKFYPHLSKQFSPSMHHQSNTGPSQFPSLFPSLTSSSTINSYVYTRLAKSSDLLAFTNQMRSTANNRALEALLKKHFARMHKALTTLKRAGFIYTDFKPENVLVDSRADRAYLIDLESVVSSTSRIVCLRTLIYSPPLFSRYGQLVDIDGLSSQSAHSFFYSGIVADPFDRILSWTFCFSIYILMCQRPSELMNYSRLALLRDKFRYWISDAYPFVSYFGCSTGALSKELTDLLNSCLVGKHVKSIFSSLAKHAWFSNPTSTNSNPNSFPISNPFNAIN